MKSLLSCVVCLVLSLATSFALAEERPNILWISSEDHGPHMGCYGDTFATTPNVDALAARGLRYNFCWSNAPVCAPARTTLITGVYASSSGGHHMRSMVPLPDDMKLFPHYLREAGYYCSNNVKEDYNVVKPGGTWDESSNKAHWRKRAKDQPFFAVFNSTKSHESQIRTRPHQWKHDPAKVRVPAYHPDTEAVRKDWAQYYDQVSAADADAGKVLAQLKEDGLDESTIVFYFGDHGSGMPRNKRSACNSGLHVPLVVYFPEKLKHLAPEGYKPGGTSDRLVSFVDFAPTVLSIAGIEAPHWMQGRAFAGKHVQPARSYLFGHRDRMDERYDMTRAARDERYVYVRHYYPHIPAGQYLQYMFQTPTTVAWKRLFDEGKLNAAQSAFWQRKAAEELYDLRADPDEVNNLASSAEHAKILERFRTAHLDHVLEVKDLGFLPESEMLARSKGDSPYALGHDAARYPIEHVVAAAQQASNESYDASELLELFSDDEPAVRYWGAVGFTVRGEAAVRKHAAPLRKLLSDASPAVRIAAADALARFGEKPDQSLALETLIAHASPADQGAIVPIAALNALSGLGPAAAPLAKQIRGFADHGQAPYPRYREYTGRLLEDLRAKLPQ